MALKTRRHNRYQALRNAGFLPFEARPLSRVPSTVPYFRQLVADRLNDVRVAKKAGVTLKQYEDKIKGQYGREGWLKRNRAGKIVADPWKMLRAFEGRYRARQPEYESPWEKRYRNLRDFIIKIERTMQRQRGLAT